MESTIPHPAIKFLACCLLAACAGSAPEDEVGSLAIRHVTVIDGVSSNPLADQTVLIVGERITAIGGEIPIPDSATVIDGTGRYLIPGLWDMHVHLAALSPKPRIPERLLEHGVTSFRDMGGRALELIEIRRALEVGERQGARLFIAGRTINGTGEVDFHQAATNTEELRAVVEEHIQQGVDFLKVHHALRPELFALLIEEAALRDLELVGHPPLGISLAEASEAGMRTIEHVEVLMETTMNRAENPAPDMRSALEELEGPLGQAVFELFARNGTAHTPTLSAYEAFVESQPDEASRAMGERLQARLTGLVPLMQQAGVTLLAGTDNAGEPGEGLHRELELLVEAGLTPAEALQAATRNAATIMGRQRDLGTIEVGRIADLVLLEANPLEDINNVRRIVTVIQAGRVVHVGAF